MVDFLSWNDGPMVIQAHRWAEPFLGLATVISRHVTMPYQGLLEDGSTGFDGTDALAGAAKSLVRNRFSWPSVSGNIYLHRIAGLWEIIKKTVAAKWIQSTYQIAIWVQATPLESSGRWAYDKWLWLGGPSAIDPYKRKCNMVIFFDLLPNEALVLLAVLIWQGILLWLFHRLLTVAERMHAMASSISNW